MGQTRRAKMTRDQALGLIANDIADGICRDGGYDGWLPEDQVDPALIERHLPEILRLIGVTTFDTPTTEPSPAEAAAGPVGKPFLTHTCNDGDGPYFGRLKPAECARCAEREEERRLGIPAREAPPAVQASQRRRQLEEETIRDMRAHNCATAGCFRDSHGKFMCTAFQW